MVYAHLIANIESEEDRDKFDGELYEPFPTRSNVSTLAQIGG